MQAAAGRADRPGDAGPGMSMGRSQALGASPRIDVETSTGGNTGAAEIEISGKMGM